MNNAEFLSNLFHDFGEISIELNFALNTIIRSYRSKVDLNELDEAKMKISSFISLLFSQEDPSDNMQILQMRAILRTFIEKNKLSEQVNQINQKIKERKELSNSEIDIIDSMIGLISREAEMAFRKMRNFL